MYKKHNRYPSVSNPHQSYPEKVGIKPYAQEQQEAVVCAD